VTLKEHLSVSNSNDEYMTLITIFFPKSQTKWTNTKMDFCFLSVCDLRSRSNGSWQCLNPIVRKFYKKKKTLRKSVSNHNEDKDKISW